MAEPFGQKLLLLERIALGGMAEVFRAKSFGVEGFERLVAVKRILPSLVQDGEFIKMFIDEARIAANLSHQNIIQIYDLGRFDDLYYISMEYVAGRDLRLILDHFKRKKSVMDLGMAAYILSRVAEALDYAHRKRGPAGKHLKIIHRDVSPQNVLVSYEGDVKLCDFGIAKAAVQSTRTQAGVLKGKFAYMSPEQVRGRPIDHRSDLFALGVVFFEMLTGERVFLADNDYTTLENVREGKVPKPRAVNRSVSAEAEQICLKLLAKDPDRRYQFASEVFEDLFQLTSNAQHRFHAHHLRQFMHEAYARELSSENAKLESYQSLGPSGVAQPLEATGDLEDPGLSPAVSALLAAGLKGSAAPAAPTKEPELVEGRPPEGRAASHGPGAGVFDRLLFEAKEEEGTLDPVTAHDFEAGAGRSEELHGELLKRELSDGRDAEVSSAHADGPTLDDVENAEVDDLKTEAFPAPEELLELSAPTANIDPDEPVSKTEARPSPLSWSGRADDTPPPATVPEAAGGAPRPARAPVESRSPIQVQLGLGQRGLGLMAIGAVGLLLVAVVGLVAWLGGGATASLALETSPTQAVSVYLDGSLISEETPVIQDGLELGPHVIELRARGFQPYRQEFSLEEARPHTLSIPLVPERP